MKVASVRGWLVVGVVACGYPKGGTMPGPVSAALIQNAQTRWPAATEASLIQARTLFVERCQKCHDLPDRRAVSEQEWPPIMDRMANKANLDPAQREQVLQFILAERQN